MSDTTKSRRAGPVRRVAETALDIAVGGTALAADKALEAIDRVVARGEGLAGNGTTERGDERDGRPYEDRARDDLYELATERGIEGRSSMRKAELIAALRAER